jgi:hypothetical protein
VYRGKSHLAYFFPRSKERNLMLDDERHQAMGRRLRVTMMSTQSGSLKPLPVSSSEHHLWMQPRQRHLGASK